VIQEIGFFYPQMALHQSVYLAMDLDNDNVSDFALTDYLTEVDFGLGSTLRHLSDPLGEVAATGKFAATAYLYWCHVEDKVRNYLPRPAAREMIADMRASLRLKTYGHPKWDQDQNPLPAATGLMGYRFYSPSRRWMSDFVVLRCASNQDYLMDPEMVLSLPNPDAGDGDLNNGEMEELRALVLGDLAAYLSDGRNNSDYASIYDSVEQLDRSRPHVLLQFLDSAVKWETPVLGDSLDAMAGVDWWDPAKHARLKDYYLALAVTYYVERGAELLKKETANPPAPEPGQESSAYITSAWFVARQTELLEEYAAGRTAGGRLLDLVTALKDQVD
jgi:hypothetical protein